LTTIGAIVRRMKSDVVLLPGLHGSIALFESFIALAPPWARCLPIALPVEGGQSFDSLADALEPRLRPLEGFVLFAESFAAPVAARLAERLGTKVALLVLCNPLVEAPLRIVPPLAASLLRSRVIPRWAVSFLMTGGNRTLAAVVLREVRELPKATLRRRLEVATSADPEDLRSRLVAPLLGIVGSEDRLISVSAMGDVIASVPFAVLATVAAPHLAAQVAPAEVWAAIAAEFQRAA